MRSWWSKTKIKQFCAAIVLLLLDCSWRNIKYRVHIRFTQVSLYIVSLSTDFPPLSRPSWEYFCFHRVNAFKTWKSLCLKWHILVRGKRYQNDNIPINTSCSMSKKNIEKKKKTLLHNIGGVASVSKKNNNIKAILNSRVSFSYSYSFTSRL